MKTVVANRWASAGKHAVLIAFSFLAIFPVFIIIMNSFKTRAAIFANPYKLPGSGTFSLAGYEAVHGQSDFLMYYKNSLIITIVSIILITLFASMVAFCLSEYKFRGNGFFYIFFILGLLIPIRLGSVSLLDMMVSMQLVGTLLALILVYIAQGLSLAVLVLTQFMRSIPKSIKEAARIEGAGEYKIYLLTVPLIKPALATVAVFTIIPIWNDIWFPLILAPGEATRTVTLGAQQFLGQFSSDWNAVLAALSMSIVPIFIMFFVFSKQIMSGLTSGSVK